MQADGVALDLSTWSVSYPKSPMIPAQYNNKDCGIFTCMFCNRLGIKGATFDFGAEDMVESMRVAITMDLKSMRVHHTAYPRQ